MRADIITLFPAMFDGVIGQSILRIAREKGLLEVGLTDLRDFATDRYGSVDDRPFGGGPGMVIKPVPLSEAIRTVISRNGPGRLIIPDPRGVRFNQALAREWSKEAHLIFFAAHYEGYDERIVERFRPELVSLGDFVVTGGELPALTMLDATVRLLPGVLGDPESSVSESFAPENAGWLEYPQYTRPAEFEGLVVPEVLLSGDHAKIAAWRKEQARLRTKISRPDLLGPEGK